MRYNESSVVVLGLGYVGLPTAAILAEHGHSVVGVDTNPSVVEKINAGEIHIIETGLEDLVKRNVKSGRLRASAHVEEADVFIVCVPTPFKKEAQTPTPDLSFVESAAHSISRYLRPGNLVLLESTSPVGTTDALEKNLADAGVDTSSCHLAYCPERILPGNVLHELSSNSRVVGGFSTEATERAADFYKTFVSGDILKTSAKTAEMCKLAENSFRDVNIAFANELSIICDQKQIDVRELIRLANQHPRVNILNPSTGVGGHCVAVDPWFIVSSNPEDANLIRTAREVNNFKPIWVAQKVKAESEKIGVKKIFCFGLAFKADIDDLRQSPAAEVVDILLLAGLEISCVEPNIQHHSKYDLCSLQSALDGDGLNIMLVAHREFRATSVLEQLSPEKTLDFCGVLAEPS